MGVKYLNNYLVKKCAEHYCSNAIMQINLNKFADKIIVIDTSIYMYKFLEDDNNIINNFKKLISLLLQNKITPIFIFDGKAPPEKQVEIKKRRIDKDNAEKEYNLLIKNNDINNISQESLNKLKNKFIRINDTIINKVKELITENGIQYYDADGEADVLCAKLVIMEKAFACLSDDMDLLVYGCSRVLRNLNIINGECNYYITENILKCLNMSLTNFRQVIVLLGTDYNNTSNDIYSMFKLYEEYLKDIKRINKKRILQEEQNSFNKNYKNKWGFNNNPTTTTTDLNKNSAELSFYQWLNHNSWKSNLPRITNDIIKTFSLFLIENNTQYENYKMIQFM